MAHAIRLWASFFFAETHFCEVAILYAVCDRLNKNDHFQWRRYSVGSTGFESKKPICLLKLKSICPYIVGWRMTPLLYSLSLLGVILPPKIIQTSTIGNLSICLEIIINLPNISRITLAYCCDSTWALDNSMIEPVPNCRNLPKRKSKNISNISNIQLNKKNLGRGWWMMLSLKMRPKIEFLWAQIWRSRSFETKVLFTWV